MAQETEQLVDEATMEKMSVAPPDPEAEQSSQSDESLMQQLKDGPGEHRLDQDTSFDAPRPGESGVADEDPLSAHPT